MSYMKRLLEDIAQNIHTGNRAEIEDYLSGTSWTDKEKLDTLLYAIEFNGWIEGEHCQCVAHKLEKAGRE